MLVVFILLVIVLFSSILASRLLSLSLSLSLSLRIDTSDLVFKHPLIYVVNHCLSYICVLV